MKNFIKWVAAALSVVLALLVVLILPISVFSFDLGRVVFNQALVTEVVTDVVTQSELIPLGLSWFSETEAEVRYESGDATAWVGEPDVLMLISFMSLDDWRKIRDEVLPNDILSAWVETTVDAVYQWIDSTDDVPQVSWSMEAFIDRVNSEHGVNAITVAYAALPPCSEAQVADFKSRLAAAPPGTDVLYNLCQFPDPWRKDQFEDYIASLEDLVDEIPGEFDLTDALASTEDTAEGAGAAEIKAQLRMLRRLMPWAPVVPLILLGLIAALVVRSLRGLGLWWGIPLILGSLLVLIAGVLYKSVLTLVVSASVLSEVPPAVMKEATQVIGQLAEPVFRPMLWQGAIVLAIGVVLLIAGVLKQQKMPATDGSGQ